MEQENRTVSIIVPVYNVKKYIIDTIESVRQQSYQDFELILVEDGSTDGTKELVEEYLEKIQDKRLIYLMLPENIGAANARNEGVKISTGRYVGYLDSDDVWKPEKLEHQIKLMTEKKAGFSFTGYEFANENAQGTGKIVRVPETINYKQALKNTTIFTSTVIFDTTIVPRDQIMMPDVKSEDTALWWKLLRTGIIAYGLDENQVYYRRIGQSLSSNKVEAIRRIWNLYRKCEGLSVISSVYYFCFWAVNAVCRRV